MNPNSVRCAHCGAAVNTRCVIVGTQTPLRWHHAHPSRLEAVGLPTGQAEAVAKYREFDDCA